MDIRQITQLHLLLGDGHRVDQGGQQGMDDEPAEHAAGYEYPRDPGSDDIAYSHIFRGDVRRELGRGIDRVETFALYRIEYRRFGDKVKQFLPQGVDKGKPKTLERRFGKVAPFLS